MKIGIQPLHPPLVVSMQIDQILFMIRNSFSGSAFLQLAPIYHSCFCSETLFPTLFAQQMLWWSFSGFRVGGSPGGAPSRWRHRSSNPTQLKRFNCCINISLKLAHCAPDNVQFKLRFRLHCVRLYISQFRSASGLCVLL